MSEVNPAPVTLPRRLLAEAIGAAIGLGLVIALFPRHATIPEPKAVARPSVTSTVPAIQES